MRGKIIDASNDEGNIPTGVSCPTYRDISLIMMQYVLYCGDISLSLCLNRCYIVVSELCLVSGMYNVICLVSGMYSVIMPCFRHVQRSCTVHGYAQV